MRESTRLEILARNLNQRFNDNGPYVVVDRRNGHTALDEYRYEGNREICVRTITVGTKREIADFLHAMMVGIDLSRQEDWRIQGVV